MKQNAARFVLAMQIDLYTFTSEMKYEKLGNIL